MWGHRSICIYYRVRVWDFGGEAVEGHTSHMYNLDYSARTGIYMMALTYQEVRYEL